MTVIERHQRRRRGHARRVTIDPTDATHGAQQLPTSTTRWCTCRYARFHLRRRAVSLRGRAPARERAVDPRRRGRSAGPLAAPFPRRAFSARNLRPRRSLTGCTGARRWRKTRFGAGRRTGHGSRAARATQRIQTEHVDTDEVCRRHDPGAPRGHRRGRPARRSSSPICSFTTDLLARGDIEMSKEPRRAHGRTSCPFCGESTAVFFTAAASVLMQELRTARGGDRLCSHTGDLAFSNALWQKSMVPAVVLHLPTDHPDLQRQWRIIALALGARPG